MKQRKKEEFFTVLPSDIIADIISRLRVRTILSCKCVCKSWLDLLESDEFVKYHLSKSVPGLAVTGRQWCKIFEFVDVVDLQHLEVDYILGIAFQGMFNCTHYRLIQGSANGLLFLLSEVSSKPVLYVVNPITRDYIRIHSPPQSANGYREEFTSGFGASRKTGQHKVVRIFHEFTSDDEEELTGLTNFPSSECQVYTLGTGSWRSITPIPMLEYDTNSFGAFVNGNLHWLVFDLSGCPWISCFDLEHELFSIFPSPPAPAPPSYRRSLLGLFALEDCLCLSDSTSDDEIVIWLLKDFGVKKSWTKEFVISQSQIPYLGRPNDGIAYPIKVSKDGDNLVVLTDVSVFCYSRKTNTVIDVYDREATMNSILHTSSFLSLKTFANEKVRSF